MMLRQAAGRPCYRPGRASQVGDPLALEFLINGAKALSLVRQQEGLGIGGIATTANFVLRPGNPFTSLRDLE